LQACDRYEAAFESPTLSFEQRIVSVDAQTAKLWGQLRGRRNKNQWDMGVAATAIVHDMAVVTRNTADFEGCAARIVNPFGR
jgi:predicted nucleic acid-binding protein